MITVGKFKGGSILDQVQIRPCVRTSDEKHFVLRLREDVFCDATWVELYRPNLMNVKTAVTKL